VNQAVDTRYQHHKISRGAFQCQCNASKNNSSATAEMAAQCCTSRITFEWEVLYAFLLRNLWEYHNKSYTREK